MPDDTTNPTASATPQCPRCGMTIAADAGFCEHCGAKIGPHKHVPWWHVHRRVYDWTLGWAYRPSASLALFTLSFAESSFFPIPPDVLLMPLVLGNRKRWLWYASVCSLASVLGAVAGFLIGWLLWAQVGTFFHDHVPGFHRDTVALVDGSTVEGLIEKDSLDLADGGLAIEPAYPLRVREAITSPDQPPVELATLSDEQVQEGGVHVGAFTKVGKWYEKYNFWIVFTAGFTPIPFKVITITAGVFKINFLIFVIASIVSRSARFFLVAGLMRLFGPRITPFIDKYFNLLSLLFVVLLVGGFVAIKYSAG